MSSIVKVLVAVALVFCGCKNSEPTRRAEADNYGCKYPAGTKGSDWDEYAECNLAGRFEQDCLLVGGEMVGPACRVIRSGQPEYTAPSAYTHRYDFSDASWTDCKPHAIPAREAGDPHDCYGVEEGDDPSKTPAICLADPPSWCPTKP